MCHRNESAMETGIRMICIAQLSETASLRLLAAIDGTVDALVGVEKVISGLSTMLANAADEIQSMPMVEGVYIDEDDTAIDAMARAASQLKTFLTNLVLRRRAIDEDARLKNHLCEALHDAYECTIGEVAGLIEVLENTRSAIISHDLKAEPRGNLESFSSVEKLIASLHGERHDL